jgi:hypothetical protein
MITSSNIGNIIAQSFKLPGSGGRLDRRRKRAGKILFFARAHPYCIFRVGRGLDELLHVAKNPGR